jgi:hypothetical protein
MLAMRGGGGACMAGVLRGAHAGMGVCRTMHFPMHCGAAWTADVAAAAAASRGVLLEILADQIHLFIYNIIP